MRRLTLFALLAALVAAACSSPPERDTPGAVFAEVEVPGRPPALTHGNDPLPPRPAALAGAAAPSAAWPCEGDGTTGNRVQLVYAHGGTGSLEANRSAFEAYARRIEGTFLLSAAKTGGERLVRFVTDANCRLSIVDRSISSDALASFDAMISELWDAGLNRTDRAYHAWVESAAYCGIGTVWPDDSASAANLNNRGPSYSRSDRACWNYAETHEIVHNLGGVQNSAPNATGGLHCRDEADVMCYADGAPKGQMVTVCANPAGEDRLDCRQDDYFSTAPAGYLASHWNVAESSFLARSTGSTTPTTVPPPTTTSSSTTTSTVVGPVKTTTELTLPRRIFAGAKFVAVATVTTGADDCRPTGMVAFYVSGKLLTRQALENGAASATLLVPQPGRFTIRATYEGSSSCAKSQDSSRPIVRSG